MDIPSLQELGAELRRSAIDPTRRQSNQASRLRTSAALIISDALALGGVLFLVIALRSYFSAGVIPFDSYLRIAGILITGNALVSAWRGIYPGYGMCAIVGLRSTFYSVTGVFGVVIAVSFFSKEWMPYARSILLASYILSLPILAFSRLAVRRFLSKFPWYGVPVLIVGQHTMATSIVDTLHNHLQIGLRPLAIIEPDTEEVEYGYHQGVPVIGGLEHVGPLAERYNVTHGVVTMPHRSADRMVDILDNHCSQLSRVTIVGEHIHPAVIWISNASNELLLSSEIDQRLREPSLRIKKRLFDLFVVTGLAILAFPVMLVISLAILITMRRPILFKQERVGENGKVFHVMKFRTMVTDAEERLSKILERNAEAREEWNSYHKLTNDPRVTAVGRFLRKHSLDELPQLLNVFRGEMSMVGFRPFTPEELTALLDIHSRAPMSLYDSTKPGISGLWQVTVRSDAVFEDRAHIDLYYMRNWSLFLDFYILIRTVGVVLSGRGAY